jgi:hypothetical protein
MEFSRWSLSSAQCRWPYNDRARGEYRRRPQCHVGGGVLARETARLVIPYGGHPAPKAPPQKQREITLRELPVKRIEKFEDSFMKSVEGSPLQ